MFAMVERQFKVLIGCATLILVFFYFISCKLFIFRHSLKLHWFADLMNVTEEVAAFRSPLMQALDRSVETLGL